MTDPWLGRLSQLCSSESIWQWHLKCGYVGNQRCYEPAEWVGLIQENWLAMICSQIRPIPTHIEFSYVSSWFPFAIELFGSTTLMHLSVRVNLGALVHPPIGSCAVLIGPEILTHADWHSTNPRNGARLRISSGGPQSFMYIHVLLSCWGWCMPGAMLGSNWFSS